MDLPKLKREDPSVSGVTPILQVLEITQITRSSYLLVVSDQETTAFAKLEVDPDTYLNTITPSSIIELVKYKPCWGEKKAKFTLVIAEFIVLSPGQTNTKVVNIKCDSSGSDTVVDSDAPSVSNGTDMTIDSDEDFEDYFDD
ncbi:hypothetical protein HCN44_009173 [Aphidius gifuensis]|uniref:Uncharacterized protein n=1 Tax=Aphidius gifuensis TaxID=684658 RepID=A0A835CYL2_APHGI|nr:hypothetical protein HCN44_009173 [Aphidius gifuensis]